MIWSTLGRWLFPPTHSTRSVMNERDMIRKLYEENESLHEKLMKIRQLAVGLQEIDNDVDKEIAADIFEILYG